MTTYHKFISELLRKFKVNEKKDEEEEELFFDGPGMHGPYDIVEANRKLHEVLFNSKLTLTGDINFIIDSRHVIDLPISGGWGYTKETACKLEIDRSVIGFKPYSIPEIENIFIGKRSIEEMIAAQELATEEKIRNPFLLIAENNNKRLFKNLRWILVEQKYFSEEGKKYDYFKFNIELIPMMSYLRAEHEQQDVWKVNKEIIKKIPRECYFDITYI